MGNYKGLTDEQVLKSRAKWGANVLTPAKKTPWWVKFLYKFTDPLIVILEIAGVLSVGISCWEFWYLGTDATVFFEPVGIFIAIFLSTGLSFFFENKAEKEFEVLNQVNDEEKYRVVRNGSVTLVAKKDIVVGDVVMLSTGDEVPADARLLESKSLTVDESTLTGEPMCRKSVLVEEQDAEATFATDMVMRGTKVMEGRGVCEVVAVGDSTENGKVFTSVQIERNVRTPLDEQLEKLGKVISIVSYGAAIVIVAARALVWWIDMADGDVDFTNIVLAYAGWAGFVAYMLQSVMIAVTLIVVSVPEGLPMAVTLSLAYSMRRMLHNNNLVRTMHACETMGAATVICTDKTGTLTQNRMSVADVSGTGFEMQTAIMAEGIAVNSTASLEVKDGKVTGLGNPTEGALLMWLRNQGVDYQEIRNNVEVLEEVPFESVRKYMATVVRGQAMDGRRILFVKGAPEILMNLCADVPEREELQAKLAGWQAQAMRTIGFAWKIMEDAEAYASASAGASVGSNAGSHAVDASASSNAAAMTANGSSHGAMATAATSAGELLAAAQSCGKTIQGLVFQGIAAISDPVRDDVPDAIKTCLDAGIAVKIVTGDTIGTAREIGRQCGLWTSSDGDCNIVTGPEIEAMSDEELRDSADTIKIIARARPMDKRRFVEALQSRGEVVAVTGDGTNDAPALKEALVGLSMGDGTAVAKEASDITIIDNSFSSICNAVMWGRSLYKNIQRFILFQITVNIIGSLIVVIGAFMGTQSPLTVPQMLWVNLIMDTFAAMALASLPADPSVMKNAPRNRKSFIINGSMARNILVTGGILTVLLMGLLLLFMHSDITSLGQLLHPHIGARNGLSPYELSLFFTTFVMFQFWNLFNAKAFGTKSSALHLKGCGWFGLILGLIAVGQVLIVYCGGKAFEVVALRPSDLIIITLVTSLVLWTGELLRKVRAVRQS